MNRKFLIAVLLSVIISSISVAQKTHNITISFSTKNFTKFENAFIAVEQNGKVKIAKVNDKIQLSSGTPFNITFENIIPKPDPLLNLIAFKDTMIDLEPNLLPEVVVRYKKWASVQTLNGFEYKPYLDDDYRYKSIFYALEKLPFIIADQESIKYKDGQKILFMINGKERPGIVSWNELLQNIPAKEIYKVKMIIEVPPNIQLRGYKVILDIHTMDANAFGHLITPVLIVDSRKNIQPNLTTSWLKNRMDFSSKSGYSHDKYEMPYYSKILKSNQIISETLIDQHYEFKGISYGGLVGYRLDSLTQLSLSSNVVINKTFFESVKHVSDLPAVSSLLNKKNNEYRTGLGFIKSKSDLISSGLGLSFTLSPVLEYFNNQFVNLKADSSRYELSAPTQEYLAEYFHNDFSNERHSISYVFQSYFSQTDQASNNKFRNLPTSDFDLMLSDDSLSLKQKSVSGFLQNVYKKKNKSFTINLLMEYYSIETNRFDRNEFLLPGIGFQMKQLLKSNRSLKFKINYDYLKPNLDFLITKAQFENPYETRVGSKNIIPEKDISLEIEYLSAGKFQLSHSLLYRYGYDRLRFITIYDSSLNVLVSESKNNSSSNFFKYTLNASKWFTKKLRFSSQYSLSYVSIYNKNINLKTNGWAFFVSANGTYNLPKGFGISFYVRAISNLYSDQGSKTGYFNYNIIFGKMLLKNRLAVSFIGENFLKKNRNVISEYTFNENNYYTNVCRPYKLLKLRISYRLSNIIMDRSTDKYLPTKRKEATSEL